jgi:4-amino-4-deoxy-L-arabinose transferase-like glycosyltransferase
MTAWTWFGWNDPIVDFGRELYVPWQITQGKVLYRDIAYFNGPLSPYFNALVFAVFGVSLRSIVLVNLILLALLTWMIWRLLARLADRFTATAGCLVFLTVFAFIQLVGIGNYNFVTPYSHELTHGLVLSFGAMICLARDLRSARSIWLILAGVALGLVFLTKVEVFLAAGLAVPLGVIIGSRGRVARVLGFFSGAAVVPPAVAFCLLSMAMPSTDALRGTLGSWVHVFDPRIGAMQFYRQILGTDDVAASLLGIVGMTMLYLLALVPVMLVASRSAGKRAPLVALVAALFVAALLYALVDPQWWQHAFRGLPVVLALHVLLLAIRWWARRREVDRVLVMQLVLSLFALVMLAKMGLNVRITQYGFALAMPAMLVCVAILMSWIPRETDRYNGNGAVVRAAAVAIFALVVAVHLEPFARLYASKPLVVAAGADRFHWLDARGAAVNRMLSRLSELPSGATLVVVPEGIMLNYLSRRVNPTRYINFMPPELVMFGQDQIVAQLAEHPPDYVIVVSNSDPASYGYDSPAADYRARILPWIAANYDAVPTDTPPQYPLLLMRRR